MEPDPWDPKKKYTYIEKVELELGGSSTNHRIIPSTKATLHHCPADFINFMKTQGNFRTNDGDGIDYDTFKSNCYFACFDLSTSPYTDDVSKVLPSVVQSGNMVIRVGFSETLKETLQMIMCFNFTSALQISIDGVNHTYVNKMS